MANWLEKALGRKAAENRVEPVPFELACECGMRLSGLRQERAKRVICSQCGNAFFLLPVNQYPLTARKYFSAESLDNNTDDDRADSISEDFDTDPTQQRTVRRNETVRRRVAEDGDPAEPDDIVESAFAKPRKARRGGSAGSPPQRRGAVRLENLDLSPEKVPSHRGRIALVLGILLILAAIMTGWWIHREQLEQAELRLKEAGDAGVAAFEQGDFVSARRELADAVQAANRLGLTDTQASALRTRHLHAQAAVNLCDVDLFQLVEMAETKWQTLGPEASNAEFAAGYRGKWFVISQPLQSAIYSDEDQQELHALELIGGGRNIYLHGIDHLVKFLNPRMAGQDVIIAGQFRDCRRQEDATWVIELEPNSTFLWHDVNSLQRLGFVPDDDTAIAECREIIERQTSVAAQVATQH